MKTHEVIKLDEFRIKRVYSLFPFIVVDGFDSDFIWTGKWFKWVSIKQQKIKERYAYFDDGWTYTYQWGNWNEAWKFVELI